MDKYLLQDSAVCRTGLVDRIAPASTCYGVNVTALCTLAVAAFGKLPVALVLQEVH